MSKSWMSDKDDICTIRKYNKELLVYCVDGFEIYGHFKPRDEKITLMARLGPEVHCREYSIDAYDEYCGLGAENREDLYPVLAGAYLMNR